MTLNYTLTLADYRAMLRLRRKLKLSLRLSFVFWYFIVPVLIGVAILLTFPFTTEAQAKYLGTFIRVDVLLFLCAAIVPVSRELRIRTCYKRLVPSQHDERIFRAEISDDYFLDVTPGEGEAKIFWSGIVGFAQNESVTMFSLSGGRFHFFPTRALSPEQRTELDGLISSKQVRR